MKIAFKKSFDFLGRLLLATSFAFAIPSKIAQFPIFIAAIRSKGIEEQMAIILLTCAIACLICGVGFLLIEKYQKVGASLLLIFLVPTTLIMHFFPIQSKAILTNIGLIGGLIIILSKPKNSITITKKYSLSNILKMILRFLRSNP